MAIPRRAMISIEELKGAGMPGPGPGPHLAGPPGTDGEEAG